MHLRLLPALAISALTIVFISCKKNSDHDYYVKLKINGNWITWKTVAGELGPDLGDPSKTDFGVTANNDNSTDIFDISVQVDGSSFNTGSYASDNNSYLVLVSYAKDVTSPSGKFYDIIDAPTGPPSKYTINVSSITSTELRGSFTGNYLTEFISGETLNVTEGEFFVKRVR